MKFQRTSTHVHSEVRLSPALRQVQRLPHPHRPPTVLLVHHDPAVRESFGRLLSRAGYSVYLAEEARGALDKVERLGTYLDLVVTDHELGQDAERGDVVAHGARQLVPGVRVLALVDAEDVAHLQKRYPADIQFLTKAPELGDVFGIVRMLLGD